MKENPNPTNQEPNESEILPSSNRVDAMDTEGTDALTDSSAIGKSCSIPRFLRKILDAEIHNPSNGRNHRLLILAVHAVFLESGFVSLEPPSLSAPMVRIQYTLPALLNSSGNSLNVGTVVLKFQTLGKFLSIYGCYLNSKGSDWHHIALDTLKFLPCLDYVYRGFSCQDDGSLEDVYERIFFEFWKVVKDGLSIPLLITLCNETGLQPPPCFMLLPTELKLRILEYLPGVDVAKVECVCSELKYLSSSDDLWRKKFEEKFGAVEADGGAGRWKETFVLHWKKKKMRALTAREEQAIVFPYALMRRGRPTLGALRVITGGDYDRLAVIGGDYDQLPMIGGLPTTGFGTPFGGRRARFRFSPRCNFRGGRF